MAYHPFRHLGLKILAISVATLLWLTVAGEHTVERALRVPLELRNLPPQIEIVDDPPATVDVRLRGSSGVLGRLEPGQVVATVDLVGARPGARLFHLKPEEVKVPYGVTVAQVLPPTLSLELEKSMIRTVPVHPAVEGDPAPGFVIGRISSKPSTVQITGPETRVKQVSAATTESVTIDGARDRVRDVVTVGVADPAVRLLQPEDALVSIEVLPAPVERAFEKVPIRWRNLGDGMKARIVPAVGRISVRGQRQALDRLRADSIEAFVDLAGLGPGRYNLGVQADSAPDFGISSVDPGVVAVTIR